MRAYELMFVIKPGEEESINNTIAKFENLIKDNGGTIDKLDRWGKKRLAYEVDNFTEGYYCLINFHSQPSAVHELERVLKITDEVLRYLIVKE